MPLLEESPKYNRIIDIYKSAGDHGIEDRIEWTEKKAGNDY